MTTAELDTSQILQAGEYVLGTLDHDARERFRERLAESSELQRAVREWQHRLQPLAESTPRVMPSSSVWRRVTQRLDLDRASPFATDTATRVESTSTNARRSAGLTSAAPDDDLAAFLSDTPVEPPQRERPGRPSAKLPSRSADTPDDASGDGERKAVDGDLRGGRSGRRRTAARTERETIETSPAINGDAASDVSTHRLVRRLRRSRRRWQLSAVAAIVVAVALATIFATTAPMRPGSPDWVRPAVLGVVTDAVSGALWSVELATRPAQARVVPLAEAPTSAESFQLWLLGENDTVIGTLGLLPTTPGTMNVDPIAPDLVARLAEATALGVSIEPTLGSPDPTTPSGPLVYRAALTSTAQPTGDGASGV